MPYYRVQALFVAGVVTMCYAPVKTVMAGSMLP
eukprot:COSAG05_NODE_407_length_10145_cov_234.042604_3_plen_33_part_00